VAQLHREAPPELEPMRLLDVRLDQVAAPATAERIAGLTARGPLIVTDEKMLYPLVEYLRRYTTAPIRLVTSSAMFARLLSGSYDTLPGALLEGLGKLLVEDVRLYIHSVPRGEFLAATDPRRVTAPSSGAMVALDDLRCEPPLDHLLRYLRGARWIAPLELP
jgi:hypothetical protein